MLDRLEMKSIFFDKQTFYLFFLFFLLKISSFCLNPFPFAQAFLVFCLVIFLGILFFKNPYHALALVSIEFLFGGSGHYLEFFGLSIRTVLTFVFMFLWLAYSFSDKKQIFILNINDKLFYFLAILLVLVGISGIIGLKNNHGLESVIADFIPYTIFAFVLAFFHLFEDKKFKYFFVRLLLIFLLGSAIFSLFNFIMFRLGIFEIHDEYYKWFRDVLTGKITFLTYYFYRIVLPEHLLVPPALLFISSLLMRNEKHNKMWRVFFIAAALILILNFSRAYFLGICCGFLILKYKHKLSRWLKVSLWSVLITIILFVSILFISSFGKSFGLELLGFRFESMFTPEIETSTNTRMVKLDPILNLIQNNPVFGVGLGAEISYLNPYTFLMVNEKHFDWGYLEMIAELGSITTFLFIVFYFYLIFELIKKIRLVSDYHDAYIGLLAGLCSLLIINITTPVLFHALGIFYLSLAIVFIMKPITLYEEIVTIIYRIFNKKL
ncbi:MAG: O-antigen ligase family protein [Patescibacteria group bacterium]